MLTRFSPAPQDVPAQAGVGTPSLRKRGLAQRGTQKLNFIWGRNWDEAWLFRLYPEQKNKIKPSGGFAAKPGMLWPLAGCTSAPSLWARSPSPGCQVGRGGFCSFCMFLQWDAKQTNNRNKTIPALLASCRAGALLFGFSTPELQEHHLCVWEHGCMHRRTWSKIYMVLCAKTHTWTWQSREVHS